MKTQSKEKRVCFEPPKELEVFQMDQIQKKLIKVKIQVTINNDNLIMLSYKSKILRKVYLWDFQTNIDMFQNIEQIQYLEWQGEYGQNQRKSGKWIAIWNKEKKLKIGGYSTIISEDIYYKDELKIGLWKQPIKNYWSQAKVYEIGEYFEGQKCGRWNYIYKSEIIGGGQYDDRGNGIKIGKWIELDERFYKDNQVIHNGEYKNAKKIGIWDIFYRGQISKEFSKMQKFIQIFQICCLSGSGSYDDRGNDIKIGKWIELDEGFYKDNQVIHFGSYKNGKKIGIWDITFRDWPDEEFSKMQKFIKNFYKCKFVVLVGVDHMMIEEMTLKLGNGMNQMRDFIKTIKQSTLANTKMVKNLVDGIQNLRQNFVDNLENLAVDYMRKEVKVLKLENGLTCLRDFLKIVSQFITVNIKMEKKLVDGILSIGKIGLNHSQKCKKYYQKCVTNQLFNICVSGGGIYGEAENELKQGNWVEILKIFNESSYLMYIGEYKDDKKVGRWDIWFNNDGKNERIGGGSYDELGNEIKSGDWVEILDDFDRYIQKIENGQYQDGNKVGVWVQMHRCEFNMEKGFQKSKEITYEK